MKISTLSRYVHQLVATRAPAEIRKATEAATRASRTAPPAERLRVGHEALPSAELKARLELCNKAAAEAFQRRDMGAHTGHVRAGLVYYHCLVRNNRAAAAAKANIQAAPPAYEESSDDELLAATAG